MECMCVLYVLYCTGVHVCVVCTVLYRCACVGVSDTSVVFMMMLLHLAKWTERMPGLVEHDRNTL